MKIKKPINVYEPWLENKDFNFIHTIKKNKYVTENIFLDKFEKKIKKYTKSKHAVGYCNGTMALYASVCALKLPKDSEILVSNLTFIASATSIIAAGMKPIFCDVRPNSYKLDLESAKKNLTKKTRAIMAVHLYGYSDDMDDIKKFAKVHNLKIIEDASQALGVKFNNIHCGLFGELGVISFYGNKILTCGEGGMVLINQKKHHNKIIQLKNHGRIVKGIYKHETIGYNFSLTEMQSGLGLYQFKKFRTILKNKKKIYKIYKEYLSRIDEITWISDESDRRISPNYWLVNIFLENKNDLVKYLDKNSIKTRKIFTPLNIQNCFKKFKTLQNFKNTNKIYENGISLPSSPNLKLQDQMLVIKKIYNFYGKKI